MFRCNGEFARIDNISPAHSQRADNRIVVKAVNESHCVSSHGPACVQCDIAVNKINSFISIPCAVLIKPTYEVKSFTGGNRQCTNGLTVSYCDFRRTDFAAACVEGDGIVVNRPRCCIHNVFGNKFRNLGCPPRKRIACTHGSSVEVRSMRTLLSKVLLICKDNFAIYTIGVPYRITRS